MIHSINEAATGPRVVKTVHQRRIISLTFVGCNIWMNGKRPYGLPMGSACIAANREVTLHFACRGAPVGRKTGVCPDSRSPDWNLEIYLQTLDERAGNLTGLRFQAKAVRFAPLLVWCND
jgi:hypothetical protein